MALRMEATTLHSSPRGFARHCSITRRCSTCLMQHFSGKTSTGCSSRGRCMEGI
ncbi:unnamed protein product [Linum tenue]|uniref:Uncharacterized protein n=1 Tax=Linum tenue TaxID=586396 RepID=A0AAV0Q3W2_9ROSI|nr:unnamed protein product [Linum tenue]